MEQLILIVHVLAALGIIGLILLQQGKGADMGASFGAGGSQTLFGSGGGGNVLTRGTAMLATLFFATSFGLAIVAKDKAGQLGAVDVLAPAAVESREFPDISEQPDGIPASLDAPEQGSKGSDIPEL
jgi:preprotein translocase subunit SecG